MVWDKNSGDNIMKKPSKKQIIIASIIIFAVALLSIGAIEYNRYKNFRAKNLKRMEESMLMSAASVDISGQPKKPSQYNIGIEYNKAMSSNKPVIALFFADWCGYCVRFMPIYQRLSAIYGDELEFTKVNVEDERYEDIVKNMGISGFPTVFLLDPKYENKVLISNANLSSVDSVSEEIDRFLRIRRLLDKK